MSYRSENWPIKLLVLCAYYFGLIYFLIKPLWYENLSRNHVKSTYNTNEGYVPNIIPGTAPKSFRTKFTVQNQMDLSKIKSINLLFATYQQTIETTSFKIISANGHCVFEPNTKNLVDNASVSFLKKDCQIQFFSVGEDLFLEINTVTDGHNIALWTTKSANLFEPQDFFINNESSRAYPVGGVAYDEMALKNRAAILGEIWGPDTFNKRLTVALALLILSPFLLLLPLSSRINVPLLTLLMSWTIMTLFALLSPPLQAPDEADHFITYADLIQKPNLSSEILVTMNKSHYDRVFCHDIERIDSYSIQHPLNQPWPKHAPILNVIERSPTVAIAWRLYDQYLPSSSALEALLNARSMNAVYIAVILSSAALLFTLRAGGMFGSLVFCTVATLPTFWMFASHLSNHTFLFSGYIALMIGALSLLRFKRIHMPSIIFACLLITVTAFSGRSSVLTVGTFIGLLLISTVMIEKQWMSYLLTTGGLLLVIGISLFQLQGTPYLAGIAVQINAFIGKIQYYIFAIPFILLTLIFLRKIIKDLELRTKKNSKFWPIFFYLTVAGLLLLAVLPLMKKINLPNIEFMEKPSLSSYMKQSYLALITNFGLGGDDFLVIRTLWGGFGCPDNFYSQKMVDFLKIATLLGWGQVLYWSVHLRRFSSLSKVFGIKALSLLYFALLTFACWSMVATVLGRYNVGFALLILSVSSFGYYQTATMLRGKLKANTLASIFILLTSQIAFFSLREILVRYYA